MRQRLLQALEISVNIPNLSIAHLLGRERHHSLARGAHLLQHLIEGELSARRLWRSYRWIAHRFFTVAGDTPFSHVQLSTLLCITLGARRCCATRRLSGRSAASSTRHPKEQDPSNHYEEASVTKTASIHQ